MHTIFRKTAAETNTLLETKIKTDLGLKGLKERTKMQNGTLQYQNISAPAAKF